MRTKQWYVALVAMAVAVGIGSRQAYAANTGNPVDATITITPTATINLSLGVTTYAYGSIPVSSQAVSVSSLSIINIGDVNVSLDSKIQTEAANWISDTSTGTVDHYVLYVATSATQPLASQFTVSHQFTPVTGGATAKPLAGLGGGSPNLATTGATNEVDLWFRLDTPNQVSTLAGQTIDLRFHATAL